MGELLKKRWLGDHLIAAVGLLVAGAMAALLFAVVLVADYVDRRAIAREHDLMYAAVDGMKLRLRNDLASFALPEMNHGVDPHLQARWLHRHFGGRLYAAGLYDRGYIFDRNDRPFYASADGMLLPKPAVVETDNNVLELVKTVRATFQNAMIMERLMADDAGETAPPPASVFRAVFARIENKPAIAAAISTAPVFARSDSRLSVPPVIAVVAFFDKHMLGIIETELSIKGLRIAESAAHKNEETGVYIPSDHGQGYWLFWTANRPGAAILARIAPALGLITLFFGFVTILVLRTMRRANNELAISERRAVEMAYRDPLTGLANRLRLVEQLKARIPALEKGQKLGLFFLDLDGFKDINDTLGHPVGDELLAVVGERLEGILGSKGMTVRFGGDEFAVLAPIADEADIERIAERIKETVRQPATAGEHMLQVGVTIGISLAPDHGSEPEELLRRADIALYKAKAEGRGAYRMFEPSDENVLQTRRALERDIERAIWHDEFFPLFQPIMSVDGERMEGVETLVRWQHPERGLVSPADFIHVAEKSGLIVRLDEWVLRKACEHGLAWPGMMVAVNMSPSNFRQSNLAERVKRVIEETGFDPRRLEIEITEGMLLNANEDVLFDLAELREYGIRFAIDDFGTGYSSLGYLGSFPVDKIKIDQSFVQNLGIKEDAAAIVECVARLGRALGMIVTAEGVETASQHRFVRAAGCQQVQGYLFSKPVRPGEVSELLAKSIGKLKRA
ncbi:MAG: EAL domain-containing protein [Xanthobacteraceae bacterium]|nr:EAL domain-containing protein [Xanthobacteraceae bacterium]QYK43842.1 MAG: EAL domain-containing protein [Xanthobacteraceae bacterium]